MWTLKDRGLLLLLLLLLRSATRCRVKGLHGCHSWRIASSEIVRWHGQPVNMVPKALRADLRAEVPSMAFGQMCRQKTQLYRRSPSFQVRPPPAS